MGGSLPAAVSLGICHLQGRAGLEKNETLARACFEEVCFNPQTPSKVIRTAWRVSRELSQDVCLRDTLRPEH